MYQEGTDRLIWSNFHTDFEDWKESTSEDYEDYSEDRLYEIFCEAISDNLDDERCNLDIQLSSPILVIGDLGLWYGRRTGYKEIESGNIRDCLYSDTDYTTYSPIISILTCTTSKTKHPLPTHISLPAAETGMKYDSICLCEQPMSIAKDDLLEFITSLSDEHMEKVNAGLRCQLCL